MTSGSSLFTLGFERPPDLPSAFAAFAEAAIGLSLLALLIAYLPTIYSTFSRREVAVTDLAIRAGTPPTPAQHARPRAPRPASCSRWTGSGSRGRRWFTEVQETHTSYGSLAFFRSPNPHRSWVTAAGAVLDTAAIRLARRRHPVDRRPRRCASARAISRCARSRGSSASTTTTSPRPDEPISVTRDEFDEVCDELVAAGVPVHADRDQAWRDFAGWRVNYDRVLVTLAGFVMAPYAPWVSDRSPIEPLQALRLGRDGGSRSPAAPNVTLPHRLRGRRRARSRGRLGASRRMNHSAPKAIAERVGRHRQEERVGAGSGSRARPSRRACGRRSRRRRRWW